METIKDATKKLEEAFKKINKQWYNNALEMPVITLAPMGKNKSYGWCTTWKAWTDGETENYEINICADYASRPWKDTITTMMHECVHLYNIMQKVQDCSRGGTYHNKKYKAEAERRGLNVESTPKYGWTVTTMNKDATKWYSETFQEEKIISRREAQKGTSKKSKSYKHTCPNCGNKARTTKYNRLICGDCFSIMAPQDEDITPWMDIEQVGGEENED